MITAGTLRPLLGDDDNYKNCMAFAMSVVITARTCSLCSRVVIIAGNCDACMYFACKDNHVIK